MPSFQSSLIKRLARFAPVIVTAAGLIATLFVANQTVEGRGIKERLDFEKEATARANLIEAQLQGNLQRLRALAGFVVSRGNHDRRLAASEFKSFITQGLDLHADVLGVYVIGDVAIGQEDAYVERIRSSNGAGWSDFEIRSPRGLADDRLISDRPGNRRLPLTYVWSAYDTLMRPGLDISELKNMARFARKADEIRDRAIVSIFFPDETPTEPGKESEFITRFSAILPIVTNQSAQNSAARYVRMDFSTEALIERAIGALDSEDMSLTIINEDDRQARSFMPFLSGKRPQFAYINENLTPIEISESQSFVHTINFPNSSWQLVFTAKPGHYEVPLVLAADRVLAGLLITLLLVSTTNLMVRRREEILELVEKRTSQLTAANTELHERHAELAELNKNLKRKTQEAQKASAAKSEFLATMSHEIRTPMNGVLGMASILSQSDLDKDQRHKLSVITSCGQALLDILNDILDLSKVESGRLELENKPFDLSILLAELDHAWRPMYDEKGIELIWEKEAWLSDHITGDVTRIRQVFNNLISNAHKFTENGQVRVTLHQSGNLSTQIVNHFTIEDTGIGIEAKALARIFDQFTQADASTTRKHGGTGLGLAICKNLLEHMGGTIDADSKPGQGTKIRFSFPSGAAEDAKPSGKKVFDGQAQTKQTKTTPAINILIAEDNAVNQQIIKALLATVPWHFDVVQNGDEAVTAIETGNYDVILMDIQMPVMDGIEATKHIRQLETASAQIPIIAMTANALTGDREKYLAVGMTDYISKPLNPNLLIEKTRKAGEAFRKKRNDPAPANAKAAGY